MKTFVRSIAACACTALIPLIAMAPTHASPTRTLSTVSDTSLTSVEGSESAEGTQIVKDIISILAFGYKVAFDDGVSRAKSGEVTWSMWNGSFGHTLQAAANVSPALAIGYLGWSNGFKGECRQHSYCYNK